MGLSVLEDEIRQDRAAGVMFEPRVVAQRADGDRLVTIGAVCKCVDTPVSAAVARGFRELPLEEALALFLTPRVPPADLCDAVCRTAGLILSAGDRAAEAVAPVAAATGVRVHQLGIDGRLCWDPATQSIEFWFLEFQFGIGRIDAPPPAGYQTPAQLRERFGREVG